MCLPTFLSICITVLSVYFPLFSFKIKYYQAFSYKLSSPLPDPPLQVQRADLENEMRSLGVDMDDKDNVSLWRGSKVSDMVCALLF